jgi:hypothetical protein
MNDFDDLLERIETPHVDVAADVARGERAVRRRHRWQATGAVASTAAAAVVVALLQGGHGAPGSSAAGFADGSGGTSQQSPHHRVHHPRIGPPPARIQRIKNRVHHQLDSTGTQATLVTYRDVLAEHLDPADTKLRLAENEQSSGDSFGTKLDWNHGGMLEIVVGARWSAALSFYTPEGGMTPTTYDGHEARVSTATGGDLVVSVRHDDGTVVTLIARTSFGNNGTSAPTLGLTQQQLLAAAADPRLQLPPYLR